MFVFGDSFKAHFFAFKVSWVLTESLASDVSDNTNTMYMYCTIQPLFMV
jgi:hypothetical protein